MTEETKKLTVSDPVTPETMAHFNKLEEARYSIANQLLSIEQDRVRLLAAAHQVDVQRQRLFEQILVERGLAPNTQVEIEAKTGILKVLEPIQPAPKPVV